MDNIPGSASLGYGFNVLGSYDLSSMTQLIINAPTGSSTTYTFGGIQYNVPEDVAVSPGAGDETTQGQAFVAQSQQEFQNYFGGLASISGSYQGFKGQFAVAFAQESQSQSMYWYGVVSGSYEALVVMLQNYEAPQLSANFTQDPDVAALLQMQSPVFNQSTQQLFFNVFQKWGTHIVTKVTLGGNINYFSAVNTSFSSQESSIAANLSLEYKAVFVDAAVQAEADWKSLGQRWAQDRSVSVAATGGTSSLLQALSPDFNSNFSETFADWDQSIMSNPQVMGFSLAPLSQVFSGALGNAVSQALTAYLNAGIYVQADYTLPQGSVFPTTQDGLIMLAGQQVPNPEPPAGAICSAHFVVIDPVTLAPVVNLGGSLTQAQMGSNYAAAYDSAYWTPFQNALQGLAQKAYIVVLTVSGLTVASGCPPPDFLNSLQSCGATFAAWQNVVGQYCGDEYFVSYTFVGQQGLIPGSGLEKFDSDLTTFSSQIMNPIAYGDCFANLTVPLTQASGSGPYRIPAVTATATGATAR